MAPRAAHASDCGLAETGTDIILAIGQKEGRLIRRQEELDTRVQMQVPRDRGVM